MFSLVSTQVSGKGAQRIAQSSLQEQNNVIK